MKKTIYLAGGCFWGTQKYLDQLQGVLTTEVGFANGNTEAPTYEEVCHNNTGHAETVRVEYDAQQMPLARLLKFYFASINPTSLNRQGEDSGSQYRHRRLLCGCGGRGGHPRGRCASFPPTTSSR